MKRHHVIVFVLIFFAILNPLFGNGNSDAEQGSVTLKMGDNLPDRNNGWGLVAEEINAEFIKAHPNVEFEVESYQDQPYQEKIKIYATAGQLPDIMRYWSFSTLLHPLVESNLVEPLNIEDFEGFGWLPGALESNMVDGKLYGIPVSGDFWIVYYNKAILEECGVSVPTTMAEFEAAGEAIRAKGYIPMVTDGKDGWPLSITFDNIFWRVAGDYNIMLEALAGERSFTEPVFKEAAQAYQDFFKNSGLFNDDLVTSDYGAARNLFGQQQAAMYLMGSWELALATDSNFPEEFRANVRAAKFPAIESGKGVQDDLVAWFGGNYIIKADSEHKDLALEYLKTYVELYPKLVWDMQAAIPAQTVAASDKDTPVAKDLLAIGADATATSGTTGLDLLTPAFKEDHQKLCKSLAAGVISVDEFCEGLQAAADKVNK